MYSILRAPLFVLLTLGTLGPGALFASPELAERVRAVRVVPLPLEKLEAMRRGVQEVLEKGLRDRAETLTSEVPMPQLVLDQDQARLEFPPLKLQLAGLPVGGIPLAGTLTLEGVELDFGRIGLEEYRLLGPVVLKPEFSSHEKDVEGYLARQGFQSPYVQSLSGGEILMGGRRPIQMLVFRASPVIEIAGRFALKDNVLRFEKSDILVRDTNGAIAAGIQRKIRGEPAREFLLTDVLSGFTEVNLKVAPGEMRILGESRLVFRQDLRGEAQVGDGGEVGAGS